MVVGTGSVSGGGGISRYYEYGGSGGVRGLYIEYKGGPT